VNASLKYTNLWHRYGYFAIENFYKNLFSDCG
jgi:hypothetical protein